MTRRDFLKAGALFVPVAYAQAQQPNVPIGRYSTQTEVIDWARRVVANGGAYPSGNTLTAMNAFVRGMKISGLWPSMIALNFIAPDGLIAASTPLVVGPGIDPWANVGAANFVAADLSVNGLGTRSANRAWNTGVNTTYLPAAGSGMSIMVSSVSGYQAANNYMCGYLNAGGMCANIAFCGQAATTQTHFCQIGPNNSASVATTQYDRGGFLCASRTATNLLDLYYGTLGVVSKIASNNTNDATARDAEPLYMGGARQTGGGVAGYGEGTISFFAIHGPLSGAQVAQFYALILELRTALGGGTGNYLEGVTTGFGRRVLVNGGAQVSTATLRAVQTFWQRLISKGLDTLMFAVNGIVPDDLTAALTPLFVKQKVGFASPFSNDPWTNRLFVGGDLSVNGLQGAAGKRMDTGVAVGQLGGFSYGLTAYCPSLGATGGSTWGSADGAGPGSHILEVAINNSPVYFTDNTYETGNGRFFGAGDANNPQGYVALVRTANNASSFYHANSGVAHNAALSSVTVVLDDKAAFVNSIYFMAKNDGTAAGVGNFVDKMSFAALHSGLTSTQSSDFFDAIQAFRTALGGGYV